MAPIEKETSLTQAPALEGHEVAEPGENLWNESQKLFDQIQEEMESLSAGKEVQLVGEEANEERLKLTFQLVGLNKDNVKISMTKSNFLEIEHVPEKPEAERTLIWAFPVGQSYKNQEITTEFVDEYRLAVTVYKDPDFKPEEDAEAVAQALVLWEPCWLPESDGQDEEIQAETIEPIQAEISENDGGFVIDVNVDGFDPEEVTVHLADNHVLKVEGEKKTKTPETEKEPEGRLSRKSFGRMFWIPEGCHVGGIEVTARKIYSVLNLEISIPKAGSGQTSGQPSESKPIPIKVL